MKLADATEYCRKLRLRKAPLRYRPKLIYLVEVAGCAYVHPSRNHLTGGQTIWTDPTYWFQCHKDAKDFANTRKPHEKARVVKLNVCAFEEKIIRTPRKP